MVHPARRFTIEIPEPLLLKKLAAIRLFNYLPDAPYNFLLAQDGFARLTI
jgi:hypothetical protein